MKEQYGEFVVMSKKEYENFKNEYAYIAGKQLTKNMFFLQLVYCISCGSDIEN